jgi:hypothetical protein
MNLRKLEAVVERQLARTALGSVRPETVKWYVEKWEQKMQGGQSEQTAKAWVWGTKTATTEEEKEEIWKQIQRSGLSSGRRGVKLAGNNSEIKSARYSINEAIGSIEDFMQKYAVNLKGTEHGKLEQAQQKLEEVRRILVPFEDSF